MYYSFDLFHTDPSNSSNRFLKSKGLAPSKVGYELPQYCITKLLHVTETPFVILVVGGCLLLGDNDKLTSKDSFRRPFHESFECRNACLEF